ncbi:MAG: ribosome maturation factor RimM [Oscillibacter sp.]|jgi:16S rRNA processing protein RimM|nr:ribosome maturation factor RimM [Oscillibacter sp.]
MKQEWIKLGRIVNAHGIHGEIRVQSFELDPEKIAKTRRFLLDGQPVIPDSGRVHKGLALLKFPGVDDMNAALALKGKILSARRDDVPLGPEEYLDEELLGVDAFDADTGGALGQITLVESYPAHKVYTVRGQREYLIPAVPGVFIKSVDLSQNRMEIHMLEGLAADEN